MIASQSFVQTTFERFNTLCFEGVLPAVPIVLTKAGTFLGKMEYKSRRDFFGIVTSHYDFHLKISTGFDLSQEELEDVVIHEMIHYYIAFRNLRDTSVHGDTFRRIMDTINQEYGSIDPFFNRFPRANTPKIYKITAQELDEHLRESVPLKCDGHTIEPSSPLEDASVTDASISPDFSPIFSK